MSVLCVGTGALHAAIGTSASDTHAGESCSAAPEKAVTLCLCKSSVSPGIPMFFRQLVATHSFSLASDIPGSL